MEVQCPICGNGPSAITSDPEDLALLNQFTINLCQDTGENSISLNPEDIPCKGCTSMLTAYLDGKKRIQEILNGLKDDNILREIKRVIIAGESIKVELNGVQLMASQLDTSDTSTILQILVGKALIKMNRKLENLKQTKSKIERVIKEAKSSLLSEFTSDCNASEGQSDRPDPEQSTPVIVNVVSENQESDQAEVEVKEEESEAIVEDEVYIPDPLNTDGDDEQGTDNVYILTTSSTPPPSSSGSSLQLRRASKIKKTIAQLQNRHRMVTRNVPQSKEGTSDNEIANAQLIFLQQRKTGESKGSPSSRCRICDVCGKSCSTKANLKQHLQCTHLKLNVRVCTKCGARFANNSNYKKHRKRTHKEVC